MDTQLKLFSKKIYLDVNVQKKHRLKITLQSCVHVKLNLSISCLNFCVSYQSSVSPVLDVDDKG